MTVYISGLVLPSTTLGDDRIAMQILKMFAGKKGDIVDVYGNSNHPNANLFDETKKGFNWALASYGNENSDIGVAEVCLPASMFSSTDRNVILGYNSLHAVFNNELIALGYPQPDIVVYLAQTQTSGYFSNNVFFNLETSPGSSFEAIEASMQELTPYSLITVTNLIITYRR